MHSAYFYCDPKGLLFRFWKPKDATDSLGIKRQLVLPGIYRFSVMNNAHHHRMSGHLGVHKTRERILEQFYWPNIFKDVRDFVASCQVCQKLQNMPGRNAPMKAVPILSETFTKVAMDIVGPLEPSSKGKKFIVTLIDVASRFPMAWAYDRVEAKDVVDCIVEWTSLFGIPRDVLTDQGSVFNGYLFNAVAERLDIRHLRTAPFHPQTNGICERFNGVIKGMLKSVCNDDWSKWCQNLPLVLLAYRTAVHDSTGFSPARLVYGKRLRTMQDILKTKLLGVQPYQITSTTAYVQDLEQTLANLQASSHQSMISAQSKTEQQYNKTVRPVKIAVGDYVYVRFPLKRRYRNEWEGPYRVLELIDGCDVRILRKEGSRYCAAVIHINNCMKFRPEVDMGPTDVPLVAQVDTFVKPDDYAPEEDGGYLQDVRDGTESVDLGSCFAGLDRKQQQQVERVINIFPSVISTRPGRTSLVTHEIDTGDSPPVRIKYCRIPYSLRPRVDEEVDRLLQLGFIRRSTSDWSAPAVPVVKPSGKIRLCVNYRELNKRARFEATPIPRMTDVIEKIGDSRFLTKLDLNRGYHQIPLSEPSMHKSAFILPSGLFEWTVMPFGLHSAPSTFARLMSGVTRTVQACCTHYFDDLVVYSNTWETHLSDIGKVFRQLKLAGLSVNLEKCKFAQKEVLFLGHVIGSGQTRPNPEKLKSVREYPCPRTKTDVRSFLGLAGYYRKYIPQFAELSRHLTALTKKDAPVSVIMNADALNSFETLKAALVSAPVLRSPMVDEQFSIQTDASGYAIAAVLSQQFEDGEHPIAYASRQLSAPERNYSTVERELLAILFAVRQFHVYIYGRESILQTDHQPLIYLGRMKNSNARLMRWSGELESYRFTISHKKGVLNGNADGLSRPPLPE